LRCAGFTVRAGDNALRPGIAAVSARLENGTLRVVAGCCPNLLSEASLYRYSDDPRDRRAEVPVDEHNHALAALRYLISRLDAHQMARNRLGPNHAADTPRANPHRPRRASGCVWTMTPCGIRCNRQPYTTANGRRQPAGTETTG
jgi:hypothetical protein